MHHKIMIWLVTATLFCLVYGPVHATRICYCPKSDIHGIGRCGELIVHDPKTGYTFDEENRGLTTLSPEQYVECPNPPSCPKCQKSLECPQRPECPSLPQCSPSTCSGTTSVDSFGIYGSNTIGEKLMPQLIEGYAQRLRWTAEGTACNGSIRLKDWNPAENRMVTIDCEAKGSETGISELISEHADIAMLSRPITGKEVESMRREGFPGMTTSLHEHVLALDGLSIIIAKRSSIPVPLSLDQIADIFSRPDNNRRRPGRTPEGIPADTRLYVRDEQSGTREMFDQLVMMPRDRELPPCPLASNRISSVSCFSSSSDLVKAVADDPLGIGFVGRAYAEASDSVKVAPIAAPCGLVQEPSIFNIKTEDYLLSRRLLLYTAKVHSIHSPGLLFYALSDVAQPVIRDAGYVDQMIDQQSARDTLARIDQYGPNFPKEVELEFNADLMRDLRQTARGANRLSISFRFRFNSTSLDTKALQDVNRLADYLMVHAPRDKILLLGFTDALGDFKSNRQLSFDRAKAVESALSSAGIAPDRMITRGYSELMPVACNDNPDSQAKNRRVEVWLLPSE